MDHGGDSAKGLSCNKAVPPNLIPPCEGVSQDPKKMQAPAPANEVFAHVSNKRWSDCKFACHVLQAD